MKSLRARVMHFIRRWHARIGVLAAIFFVLLSISGVALNHTEALHLAKTPVQTAWLMRWYGLKPQIPTRGYVFKSAYFAASDERWVINGHDIALKEQTPVGAVAWGDVYAVATEDNLYLYLADGQLVDHVTAAMLPGMPIKALGLVDAESNSRLVLKTATGDFASADGLDWQALNTAKNVSWAKQQQLPVHLYGSLVKVFSPSLPLERIVLDIHSGRFFGGYGPLVMDAAAMLLLILSFSGVWIYLRSVRKRPKP